MYNQGVKGKWSGGRETELTKIINNNVVSVLKEGNQELVIMGRGIAFQKKTGDPVDEARIEKVFTLDNKDVSEKFKTLLYEIPIECMEVSEEIISYAKLQLGKNSTTASMCR